jgi:hypothetical protein
MMKTTVEQRGEKLIPPFGRNDKEYLGHDKRCFDRDDQVSIRADLWATRSATVGAAVWAGLAVWARVGIARIGAIELLFLFAPLVIVPLAVVYCEVIRQESN